MVGIGGRAVDQQARRLDLHQHVGERQLDALEFDQRLAELLALLNVGQAAIERCLRDGQAHRRVAKPLDGKAAEQVAKAPGADQQVLGWDACVLEDDVGGGNATEAHQLFRRAKADPRRVGVDDECADSFRAGAVVQPHVHQVVVRLTAVGYPALGAVDHVAAVDERGTRGEVGRG